MKRTITVSCSMKRTFNLGNYENITPMYTASEVIELNEDDTFTDLDYHQAYIGLRRLVMDELVGDKARISSRNEGNGPYATDEQMFTIFQLAKQLGCSPYKDKNKGITLNDLVHEVIPNTHPMSLTKEQATEFIKHLRNKHATKES